MALCDTESYSHKSQRPKVTIVVHFFILKRIDKIQELYICNNSLAKEIIRLLFYMNLISMYTS